jgi:cytoplasmic iron level regulating protein YaaA (DUF328/UPF0246 family)
VPDPIPSTVLLLPIHDLHHPRNFVLLLLPPSESKTRPQRAAASTSESAAATALDLDSLSFPALTDARETMLRAVDRTAVGPRAADDLGVPVSEPELVARMQEIRGEPVAPALDVYAGVLFDQLDPAARPGPDRRVLVQSALLGVADAAGDLIPAYRLSATSHVNRLGKPASWWRSHLRPLVPRLLAEVAASPSPLVVDCRSGAYRSMMPIRSTVDVRVLEVAPVQERDGKRKVISHDAKRYRGWVTRVLLADQRPLADAEALVSLLRESFGGTLGVELDGDRLVIVDRV